MKPNFEKIINGKLVSFAPATLDKLFDAVRFDWEDCFSPILDENFVIHLN